MTGTGKAWTFGGVGLVMGLLAGLGVAVGVGIGMSRSAAPEVKLQAMTGYGTETLSMITGPIDEGNEGVFVLDYLTGDLQCFVMNPRTGRWGAWFKRNIVLDLDIEKGSGKKPSFVMSTGVVNFPRGGALQRPANCVLYVADANSGKFAAYTVPWTPGAFAAIVPQAADLLLLDKGNARAVEVRK